MGKGSSTRYEEMKQRGTSILKKILFSVYSHMYSMAEYITSNVGGHWH